MTDPSASATRTASSDVLLERLMALHPKIIDLSLGRIEGLLRALGNPEQRLPPVVHIAGTNGKGSTLAFLRAMLEAAGYTVHGYISPHLVRFHERILLAGEAIAETDLAALLQECEDANDGQPITFFEITTAAAFLAFSRMPADILLMECGLGGRLDATNVLARPALTAITPVSLDHQQYLGDTIIDIAGEKAGILKPGVTAVIGPQPAAVNSVLSARAREIGAPMLRHGYEWTIDPETDSTVCAEAGWSHALGQLALHGAFQRENAALAIACAHALSGFRVEEDAIRTGLALARWPGRMQRLRAGTLVDLLPPDWDLWLDGGHNPAAGVAVAAEAARWTEAARPLHVVFGMLNSKDPEGFLGPVAPHMGEVRAVAIPGETASISAEDAVAAAAQTGLSAETAETVPAAIASIVEAAPAPARLLICGSLYLAGHVLRING